MLLAFSSIVSALSLICLYLSVALGFNTLALLTIASFFIGIIQMEGNLKYSILSYSTVSLIGFFILPDKMIALSFIGFFGYYPIVKYYIEKLNKLYMEWILKVAFFIVVILFSINITELFIGQISAKIPLWAVGILGVAVICAYDYALNLLFSIYEKRLRKYIKIR